MKKTTGNAVLKGLVPNKNCLVANCKGLKRERSDEPSELSDDCFRVVAKHYSSKPSVCLSALNRARPESRRSLEKLESDPRTHLGAVPKYCEERSFEELRFGGRLKKPSKVVNECGMSNEGSMWYKNRDLRRETAPVINEKPIYLQSRDRRRAWVVETIYTLSSSREAGE